MGVLERSTFRTSTISTPSSVWVLVADSFGGEGARHTSSVGGRPFFVWVLTLDNGYVYSVQLCCLDGLFDMLVEAEWFLLVEELVLLVALVIVSRID